MSSNLSKIGAFAPAILMASLSLLLNTQDVQADIAPGLSSVEFEFGGQSPRVRTHNLKMTVAARAMAERKTVGDLS